MSTPTIFTGRRDQMVMASKVSVVFAPAIADPTLKTVTVPEYNAGVATQCSIRELNPTGAPQTSTDQFLCDADQVESPGPVTYSIDPIRILAGDPQNPDPWLDGLERGQTVFLLVRPGLPHADPAEAGQRLRVWEAKVNLIQDAPYQANADGAKFEVEVHLAVQKFERNATLTA